MIQARKLILLVAAFGLAFWISTTRAGDEGAGGKKPCVSEEGAEGKKPAPADEGADGTKPLPLTPLAHAIEGDWSTDVETITVKAPHELEAEAKLLFGGGENRKNLVTHTVVRIIGKSTGVKIEDEKRSIAGREFAFKKLVYKRIKFGRAGETSGVIDLSGDVKASSSVVARSRRQ